VDSLYAIPWSFCLNDNSIRIYAHVFFFYRSQQNAAPPVANLGSGAVVSSVVSSIIDVTPVVVTQPATTPKPTTIKPITHISSFTRTTTHIPAQPTTPPAEAPKPTTVTPSPAPSSGNPDQDAYLAAHNSFRAQRGAAPLTWSNELAGKAQQWANGCKFEHSGGSLGPYGGKNTMMMVSHVESYEISSENLAAGTGSSYGIAAAIKSWTDESKDYNPAQPNFSHFTQVVWKSTKQLGCAVTSCDGIFSSNFGVCKFDVRPYERG
jgi:uncharacterized protein YkwD